MWNCFSNYKQLNALKDRGTGSQMSEPYGNRNLTEGKRPDLVWYEYVGLGHVTGNRLSKYLYLVLGVVTG